MIISSFYVIQESISTLITCLSHSYDIITSLFLEEIIMSSQCIENYSGMSRSWPLAIVDRSIFF